MTTKTGREVLPLTVLDKSPGHSLRVIVLRIHVFFGFFSKPTPGGSRRGAFWHEGGRSGTKGGDAQPIPPPQAAPGPGAWGPAPFKPCPFKPCPFKDLPIQTLPIQTLPGWGLDRWIQQSVTVESSGQLKKRWTN